MEFSAFTHRLTSTSSLCAEHEGRSLREFDEKLCSLRKENFNLKLRIFFLEERLPSQSGGSTSSCFLPKASDEAVLKHNVDLQVCPYIF